MSRSSAYYELLEEGWGPTHEFGIKKSEFVKFRNPDRIFMFGRIFKDLRVGAWDPAALRQGWFLPPPPKVAKASRPKEKVVVRKSEGPDTKSPGVPGTVLSSRALPGEKKKAHVSWRVGRSYRKKQNKRSYPRRPGELDAGESRFPRRGPVGMVLSRDESASRFLRGDVNQDGQVSMLDADALLQHIYNKDNEPACLESADVNNDGEVRLGDVLQLISYATYGLFPPAAPFPACGRDLDEKGSWSDIGCVSYETCPAEEEALEEERERPSG